jgi:hypothetical protein
MVRQLRNPLNPPWSKRTAYAVLMVLDFLAAGILWDPLAGLSIAQRITAFCLFHLLAGFFLMAGMTPWRESLHSWVWRFRGTGPWLRDLWLGDRSENGLALVTFCAIGICNLLLLVVWPVVRLENSPMTGADWSQLMAAAGTTVLLILVLGTLHQWMVFFAGKSGFGMTMTVIVFALVIPHWMGYYFQLQWVSDFSPSYHYGRWLFDPLMIPYPLSSLLPMLAFYGAALVVVGFSLRRSMRKLERIINHKLTGMGAICQIR